MRLRPAVIGAEARTWVKELACTPPKDLPDGPTQALWSMDTLAEYVRKHAVEKQFGDELAKASKSTIWFILDSNETERNYGIFCLVNNKHKDPWVVLKRYRMRNRIEESYRVSKSEFDGDRARVWNVRKVRGKELCRMVALGYHLSTKCDSKRPGLPPTRTLRYKRSQGLRRRAEVALKMLYSDEVQTFGAKDLEETLPAEDSE